MSGGVHSVLSAAPGAAVVSDGDVVYIASLPDGPIVVLEGVAAVIWTEATVGDRVSIADRVASFTDRSAGEIRADVDQFVAELLNRGLLAE